MDDPPIANNKFLHTLEDYLQQKVFQADRRLGNSVHEKREVKPPRNLPPVRYNKLTKVLYWNVHVFAKMLSMAVLS